MALTATNRGQGGNNTAATSFTGVIPATNFVAGTLGVLLITTDNSGGTGNTAVCPASFADSKGNTWTLRVSGLYDPGAAAAGVELGFYTAPITTALLTTDNANFTWVGSQSTTAKNWAFVEVSSNVGAAYYVTGAVNTGSGTASPTVTTGTIPVGHVVIAQGGSESGDTWATDADATNGSWTTFRHRASGSGLTGMSQVTQNKVQTTTASTQTYNPTLTSADVLLGWIEIGEALTVTPDVLAVVTATFAPTVTATLNQLITPDLATLTTATFAPVLQLVVAPSLATLTTATFAPTVSATNHQLVTPTTASLTTSTFAPVVTAPALATPSTASLTTSAFAPTVSTPRLATPSLATLVLTTFAPTVTATAHQSVTPTTASLTTSTFAPVVTAPALQTPTTASLVITVFTPVVTAFAGQTAVPSTASLTLTTFAPTVTATAHVTVTPTTAALTTSSFAPTVIAPRLVTVPKASLVLTTYAPALTSAQTAIPGTASLQLTTFAPSVTATANAFARPATASLVLVGYAPLVVTPQTFTIPTATLTLTTFAGYVVTNPPFDRVNSGLNVSAIGNATLTAPGSRARLTVTTPYIRGEIEQN